MPDAAADGDQVAAVRGVGIVGPRDFGPAVAGEPARFARGLIMAVMVLGRVDPLTLGFFLANHTQPRVRLLAGQVYLG